MIDTILFYPLQHTPVDKTPKDPSGSSRHRLTFTKLFPHSALDLRCCARALSSQEASDRFGNHANKWVDRDGHPPVYGQVVGDRPSVQMRQSIIPK